MTSYIDSPIDVKNMVDAIIRIEGGYSHDILDSGGATRYGITKETAREYGYYDDMRNMPIELAQKIYVDKYWIKPSFVDIADVSKDIAKELFEFGVNAGTYRPSLYLQEILNVMNNRQRYYKDIVEDGIVGRKTVKALEGFLRKRGLEGERVFYNLMNCKQGAFYLDLASARVKDERFVYAWSLHRLDFKV